MADKSGDKQILSPSLTPFAQLPTSLFELPPSHKATADETADRHGRQAQASFRQILNIQIKLQNLGVGP